MRYPSCGMVHVDGVRRSLLLLARAPSYCCRRSIERYTGHGCNSHRLHHEQSIGNELCNESGSYACVGTPYRLLLLGANQDRQMLETWSQHGMIPPLSGHQLSANTSIETMLSNVANDNVPVEEFRIAA